MMTERFNVSGALLVKLFGDPQAESERFADRAGRVRDIGVTSAMYSPRGHDRARPARLARHRARLRPRRGHGDLRLARHRHAGRPHRLPQPAVRAADLALERAGRRHDHAGQLRARARGARPRTDDRRRRRTRRRCPRVRSPSSSTTCASATRRRPRCRSPRWRASPASRTTVASRGAARRVAACRAGAHPRARRPVGRRQVDHRRPRLPPVRPDGRCRADRRRRPA